MYVSQVYYVREECDPSLMILMSVIMHSYMYVCANDYSIFAHKRTWTFNIVIILF